MFANLTGWHMIAILAVVLLLFGAPKLPALARSMGQSMRIFKGEVDGMKKDGAVEGDALAEAATVEPGVKP
jgi:sec-independent protein translocase protein TatA